MPDLDEFMTVAEVAAPLKLNQQTIRNWIDEGNLPAYRIGRRARISRADFDALITAGESTKQAAAEPSPSAPNIWDGEIPLPQADRIGG